MAQPEYDVMDLENEGSVGFITLLQRHSLYKLIVVKIMSETVPNRLYHACSTSATYEVHAEAHQRFSRARRERRRTTCTVKPYYIIGTPLSCDRFSARLGVDTCISRF